MTPDKQLDEKARFGPNPGKHRDDCNFVVHGWNCSCERPRYIEALDAIAQDYIDTAVQWALENDEPGWGDWPDLPEFVWEDVRERVRYLIRNPDPQASVAAGRALSALAAEEA